MGRHGGGKLRVNHARAFGDTKYAKLHASVVGVGRVDADDGASDLHPGVSGEDGTGEEFGMGSGWPDLAQC